MQRQAEAHKTVADTLLKENEELKDINQKLFLRSVYAPEPEQTPKEEKPLPSMDEIMIKLSGVKNGN